MGEIPLDKADLLRRVIQDLQQTLQQLEASYAAARQAVLDSPHVMKGKREVAGIEASYLANGLAQTIEERAAWIRTLSALRLPDAPERVCLGSLVGIGPGGESVSRLFLILPVCGGTELPLGNGHPPLRILTPGSAMAQALMGKALGDEFSLGRGAEPLEVRLLR